MLTQSNPLETKCSAQQECRDGGDGVQLEVCLLQTRNVRATIAMS